MIFVLEVQESKGWKPYFLHRGVPFMRLHKRYTDQWTIEKNWRLRRVLTESATQKIMSDNLHVMPIIEPETVDITDPDYIAIRTALDKAFDEGNNNAG